MLQATSVLEEYHIPFRSFFPFILISLGYTEPFPFASFSSLLIALVLAAIKGPVDAEFLRLPLELLQPHAAWP